MRKLSAVIAQGFSYSATLGAALFFLNEGSALIVWAFAIVIAAAFEALFFGMKEALWAPGLGNKALGAGGFFIDGLINTAGIMGLAIGAKLLTFGPVPLILGSLDVDATNPDARLTAALSISFALGMVLSIAPHILWRAGKRPGRAAAA
jgi:hypothetical protein